MITRPSRRLLAGMLAALAVLAVPCRAAPPSGPGCPVDAQRCASNCARMQAAGEAAVGRCSAAAERCGDPKPPTPEAIAATPAWALAAAGRPEGHPAVRAAMAAPMPVLSKPLGNAEVDALFAQFAEEHRQRLAEAVRASVPQPRPAICTDNRGGPSNPLACIQALQQQQRESAPAGGESAEDRIARAIPRMRMVSVSFKLDTAALPAEPVPRLAAMHALTQKYRGVAEQLGSVYVSGMKARKLRQALNPLQALVVGIADERNAVIDAAQVHPDVRQAYVQGQVRPEWLDLDPVERAAWDADRDTVALTASLKRELGRPVLFIDRTTQLEQSDRERLQPQQAATWGEPSAEEIGLALMRAHIAAGGTRLNPYAFEHFGTHQGLLRSADRIVHVEKGGCQKAAAGWQCNVRIWAVNVESGPAVAARGRPSHWLGLAYMGHHAQLEQADGRPAQLLLRADGSGWQAPEVMQRAQARQQTLLRGQRIDEARAAGAGAQAQSDADFTRYWDDVAARAAGR